MLQSTYNIVPYTLQQIIKACSIFISLIKENIDNLKNAIERGGIIRDLEGNDIFTVLKNAVDKIKLIQTD